MLIYPVYLPKPRQYCERFSLPVWGWWRAEGTEEAAGAHTPPPRAHKYLTWLKLTPGQWWG